MKDWSDTTLDGIDIERYARRVEMDEIEKNDFNLNITRYVSTAKAETIINLNSEHQKLSAQAARINEAKRKHNAFLTELGLNNLP